MDIFCCSIKPVLVFNTAKFLPTSTDNSSQSNIEDKKRKINGNQINGISYESKYERNLQRANIIYIVSITVQYIII